MKKLRRMDRRLFTILLIVFVQMLGAAMILPILPLYAQREFDMSPQIISLLATAFFAAQFVAGPYLGRLSDKYGRVPVLILSQIGTAVSFFMLALAPSVSVLFLARILDGITGGNIIVAQAYITDITPRERRTESLGYVFAVFGLGFIFGPALGGSLSAAFGPRVPYIIAGFAAVIVVLLTWFTLDETLTPEQRAANRSFNRGSIKPADLLRNLPLMLILLIAFIGQFGLGLLQATFALYGEAVLFDGYSEQTMALGIGLLFTIIGFGQFFTQTVLLRPALRRFDEAWLVVIGVTVRATGLFIYAALAIPVAGGFASLLFAIGMGLMMPPLQVVVYRYRGRRTARRRARGVPIHHQPFHHRQYSHWRRHFRRQCRGPLLDWGCFVNLGLDPRLCSDSADRRAGSSRFSPRYTLGVAPAR